MALIVTFDHYEQVRNFRVDAVVAAAMARQEKLYRPSKRFEPTPIVNWDLSGIPKAKNQFSSIDEALAAVRHWCR